MKIKLNKKIEFLKIRNKFEPKFSYSRKRIILKKYQIAIAYTSRFNVKTAISGGIK